MITKIILDNIFSNGDRRMCTIPSNKLLDRNSSLKDWVELGSTIKIIRGVKNLFMNEMNIYLDFEHDESKESTLEIHANIEKKDYTYYMVFYESDIVMESLIVDQNLIYSRYIDNPDFALDPQYLNDDGKLRYNFYKEVLKGSLLFCFKPGEKLLNEIKNIIIVDDWLNINVSHQQFIKKFESTFPELSYRDLVNKMIKMFGFSEDYEGLEPDNRTLRFARLPEITLGMESAGSGFLRLSRLFPLMVASKKNELMLVSNDPLDLGFHPILGRSVMNWFLKDNPNTPIGKLSNILAV